MYILLPFSFIPFLKSHTSSVCITGNNGSVPEVVILMGREFKCDTVSENMLYHQRCWVYFDNLGLFDKSTECPNVNYDNKRLIWLLIIKNTGSTNLGLKYFYYSATWDKCPLADRCKCIFIKVGPIYQTRNKHFWTVFNISFFY